MFLSMMGCIHVEATSPALQALLTESLLDDDVKENSYNLSFTFAPHLGDYVLDIKCGTNLPPNCETIGSKLKKRPRGKAL
jgi:hypothetical protein